MIRRPKVYCGGRDPGGRSILRCFSDSICHPRTTGAERLRTTFRTIESCLMPDLANIIAAVQLFALALVCCDVSSKFLLDLASMFSG